MKLSCVYVICAENGEPPVKVGFSKNLRKRLSTFNVAAQKKLHVFFSKEVDDPRGVEKEAHSILSAHRLHGEWFNVDGETAKAAVIKAFGQSAPKPEVSKPSKEKTPLARAHTSSRWTTVPWQQDATIRCLGPRTSNSTPVLSLSISYQDKVASELLTFKAPVTLALLPGPRRTRYIAIPLKVDGS